jgi:hypothetical protein
VESELRRAARQVLENNSRRRGDHQYFVADHRKYPFQMYWDSCFQAIVMSLFDGPRAEAEMYSLLSTQFVDGCMPHMTSWSPPRFPWTVFLKVANWVGEDGRANLSTQPMLSAVATWEIYKRTGNRGFLERIIPELAREADYLGVQRNLLDDGLVVIVNALESGTNESPVYDDIMRLPRPRGLGPIVHLLYYIKLSRQMARYRSMGYDLDRVAALGLFLVEDMTSNALFCRSLRAMESILEEVGEHRAAGEYGRQAVLLAERLENTCWDADDGFFYTRYGSREGRKFSTVKTASGLLPLFSGLLSEEKASALVDGHLANGSEFWTEWPVPFVSVDEPSHRGWVFPSPFPSLWRTGTWVNINWLVFTGLMDCGYRELARDLAGRTATMVSRSGFREFYNSRTGKGYNGKSYGMSTLVVDMLERLNG